MILYILNAAAIWLISLVIFGLFFRRENYHGYNRFYLLCTFLAGLLLPLWHWDSSSHIVYTALKVPVQQAMLIKQSAASPDIPGIALTYMQWAAIIYFAGVLTMLAVLITDIVKLFYFYRNGKRSRQAAWTIIETHREHAPFSFLNLLFVSSKMLYNTDEWGMLLLHEREHARLFHFADMLLMQLARLFFWFNPLVYIYHRRLTLVHEYQADAVATQEPQVYGRFLVEQMMLRSAPSITHALSNEHVKRRILMLSHRSATYRQLAKLLVFPLIALFLLCFTRYDIDYQYRDAAAAYHENVSQPPVAGVDGIMCIPVAPVARAPKNENKTPAGRALKMYLYSPAYACGKQAAYSKNMDGEIALAGMENNGKAKCCSSDLLWGNRYGNITVTTEFPKYEPVYFSANGNSCSQDIYRDDAYDRTVAMYRHTQASWTLPADNSIATPGLIAGMSNRIIIADDPWNDHPYKSPGVVPPLSMDRSVFGGNEKTIFNNAVAMINPYRETTGIAANHDWQIINAAYAEPKAVRRENKPAAHLKNTTFTQ